LNAGQRRQAFYICELPLLARVDFRVGSSVGGVTETRYAHIERNAAVGACVARATWFGKHLRWNLVYCGSWSPGMLLVRVVLLVSGAVGSVSLVQMAGSCVSGKCFYI